MTEVWDSDESDGRVLIVLLALADWANDEGWCWPGLEKLSKKSRLSSRHVQRILKKLEADGRITVERGSGRGNISRYRINMTVCPVLFNLEKGDSSDERVTVEQERVTGETEKGDREIYAIRKEPSITTIESKPLRKKTSAEPDPRFPEFVDSLKKYWDHKNQTIPFNFSGADGKELNRYLSSHPKTTLDDFRLCLRNRAKSDDANHSQDIKFWIGKIQSYLASPLDRFGIPKSVASSNLPAGRAPGTVDERGGHFEGDVYVTADGKRMPGYVPPPLPKAKAAGHAN